jgi:hypothetical protein
LSLQEQPGEAGRKEIAMAKDKITCLACGGEIVPLRPNTGLDLLGGCKTCGAGYYRDQTSVFLKKWCACENVTPEQEMFFFKADGSHGWLHTVCGQITQTG